MKKYAAVLICLAALLIAAEQGWYPHEGGLMKYRVNIRFGEEPDTMPAGWKFGRVSAVTVDKQGEVYVYHRGPKADPIVVFDAKGKFLRSWGKGMVGNAHGIRCDRDGNIWTVDNGNHQVMKFTRDGKLLLTLGTKGEKGEDDKHFFRPTDIAFSPDQKFFYVSDGYGNARVVKFTWDGKYVKAWGRHGTRPGEFNTVHSIAIDSEGTVFVSDRENNRIQIFDADGNFQRQFTHLGATQNIFITQKDEMWVITHRNNIENLTYDTLAGRIMNIDRRTGRILGAMESPGHWLHKTEDNLIFIGSLTGNVFRWYPGWLERGLGANEGLTSERK
jgi:DNA-binding beta-propeller fold protein YncE